MGSTSDNRTREQLGEALAQSEKRFAEALQSARHILYRLNVQQGGYDYLSPFAEELTGYSLAEFKRISIQQLPDYFHPDDRERIFSEQGELARAVNTRVGDKAHFQVEYRLRKADGSYCWLRDQNTIYTGADGKIESIVGAAYDITEEKQATEKLLEREETFHALFETMAQGVVYQDSDGQITAVNPAAERILGLSSDQLMGRTSLDPVWRTIREDGSDFPGSEHPAMVALRTGKAVRNVTIGIFHPKEELHHWILINAVPEFRPKETTPWRVYATLTDITERLTFENELKKSETRFRTLFTSMHEGFAFHEVICNEQGEVIDYRYLDINPAFERLTGLQRDATIGKRVRELIPGIEEHWISTFGRVALTGEPAEVENYVQELDRYYRAKAYSPERGKFAVVFEEVTEHKKLIQNLEEREAELRVLFEASMAGIILVDLSGKISVANQRMAEMFGYNLDEIVGTSYPSHIHPDQRTSGDDQLRKLILGEINHLALERHYLRKDGSDFWGYLSGRRHEDANGKLIFMVGHITDISEQKQAEEVRLCLERQLLHAQKLESLGVLAGGIAHDFNNILTAIIGNAELAQMRLNPESPALENLSRIEKAAARAADLARQMLAYSGKGKFVVEAIDLNRLLIEMGHMLEVSISKKAVLSYNLTKALPTINVDATQIRQIIMNLVINASEALGDTSGVIAVTTGCVECDEAYLQEFWLSDPIPEGQYVFLEIADTGCGMDKETLAKIFDPFFTTKFTGRGLGMAAVLGIIRGHKGAIKVYSEPGKGSSFKVLLPAGTKPAELVNEEPGDDSWRGSGTALLVDDEETVRAIGGEMLRELGFTVVTACDGCEAIEKFKKIPASVVILDLTMPHMGGEQCFRELRQLDPNVRVIMSSGFSEHEVVQKFAGKGLSGFIQKPYKLSALKNTLRNTESEATEVLP